MPSLAADSVVELPLSPLGFHSCPRSGPRASRASGMPQVAHAPERLIGALRLRGVSGGVFSCRRRLLRLRERLFEVLYRFHWGRIYPAEDRTVHRHQIPEHNEGQRPFEPSLASGFYPLHMCPGSCGHRRG